MPATTILKMRFNLNPNHPELIHDSRVQTALDATEEVEQYYDPRDTNKNFTQGSVYENVLKISAQIEDEAAQKHELIFALGKVKIGTWAVEIYAPQNEDGTYDIDVSSHIIESQIASGFLYFDAGGSLIQVDNSLLRLVIKWNNIENYSILNINWGRIGYKDAVTQVCLEEKPLESLVVYNNEGDPTLSVIGDFDLP